MCVGCVMLAPVCRVLRYEIEVTNFSSSWSDGKAFCAILHRHRPDTLDYTTQVDEARPLENLQLAFDTAYDQLGVEKLLDPEGLWCSVSSTTDVRMYIHTNVHTVRMCVMYVAF